MAWSDVSLEQLRAAQAQFAEERDWNKFHTPRNLLLALVGEVGELSEIFQWRGEVAAGLPDFSPADKEHVGQELSDCLLYLLRLADVAGIDLPEAAFKKIQGNSAKYPASACRGSSAKYHKYQSKGQGQEQGKGQGQEQGQSEGLGQEQSKEQGEGQGEGQREGQEEGQESVAE